MSNSRLLLSAAVVLALAGCATQNHRAPVEDRSKSASGSSSAPSRLPPGSENAGKPGYYTVKPGDTLIRISLETGQNWRDLAGWNSLDNPNLIEVGQVLRVVPPVSETTASSSSSGTKAIASPRIESRAVESSGKSAPAASKPASASSSGASAAASTASASASAASSASDSKDNARDADEPNWQWPASGPVIGNFEEGKRKGLVIGGKAGDPIFAAADGRVVYAGSGLRGYGNLIIIKHNADYLTAYAHNQTLLVKEDQTVRKGQKIAEMGSTDADRVQLHFEIRKQGKPVDPARQLPSR